MARSPSPALVDEIRTLAAAGKGDVLAAACVTVRKRLPHYSWVGVYALRGAELELLAWAGHAPTEHTRIPLDRGLCGLAARTGRTVNVPDVQASTEYLSCFPETRSELVVPILQEGRVVGEIDIDSFQMDAFGPADEAFGQQLAAILGPAVTAARAATASRP